MTEKIAGKSSICRTIGLFYLTGYAIGQGTTALQNQRGYGPKYSLYFGGAFATVGAGVFLVQKIIKKSFL